MGLGFRWPKGRRRTKPWHQPTSQATKPAPTTGSPSALCWLVCKPFLKMAKTTTLTTPARHWPRSQRIGTWVPEETQSWWATSFPPCSPLDLSLSCCKGSAAAKGKRQRWWVLVAACKITFFFSNIYHLCSWSSPPPPPPPPHPPSVQLLVDRTWHH